ncbi:hypothetical protein FisN_30Lu135 [Fistulifera solaris]|uniref:Heme NO-binding domain-containing protein n=1 Tax=Fistulifera solaris TaxID=1519565 RepID=A0A1Z5JIK6_FISSO|nr:hypothetical protein FisN_30Lu135 [Fistulifera solaris]|eukprot:GAX13835.1 hypothetical protein FisN_30Lu135 [Fistulifera solaris]
MLGWMNDCLEKLVVEKFGIDAWHEIKAIAKCDVADCGFLRFEEYPDQGVYDLIHAGSKVSGLAYAFGHLRFWKLTLLQTYAFGHLRFWKLTLLQTYAFAHLRF